MTRDPASFRDPSGHIHHIDGKVFRSVQPVAVSDYEFFRDSGALAPLIDNGSIVSGDEVNISVLGHDAPSGGYVLEHPAIEFWSYPYEWSFSALRIAALLHLDIQIALLKHDIVLSDATAYNIQFIGAKPIFVDFLSFRRYRENEHWQAHRQFCEQFLNPLLLQANLGLPFQQWYRGQPEGITSGDLAKLAKWWHHLSLRMLGHVILPGRVVAANSNKALKSASEAKARGLPRSRYAALLNQLRSWIAGLKPKGIKDSTWHDYAKDNSYADPEAAQKRAFVSDFAKETSPSLLIDLGCNTGEYSQAALEAGAQSVIGLDADHGALEQAFARAKDKNLSFLPLYQDSTNPSPGQGWNHRERRSFVARGQNVNAVIALAFEHHLAIGRNIPLPEVVKWIVSLAPQGVIEFVRKDDPTIQKMLTLREDIFTEYSVETFVAALENSARIIRREKVSAAGRELFWFDRQ